MHTAYITHPSFMLHEMGSWHPESPERLAAISDRLLAEGLLNLMTPFEAPEASAEQIMRAHDAHHYHELHGLAPESGYAAVDPDTSMNSHTWSAALHAAGAAVLATELVALQGYTRAFAAVRPPGHHAERGQAMGFCFFNNIAIGARHALDVLGFDRVAIVDFDVHHGNGTEDIVANDERIFMVSAFEQGLYPHSGEEPRGSNMCNVGLKSYSDGAALRAAVTEHWLPLLRKFEPELIFISAGFDAHREDDISRLAWRDEDFGWVTRQIVVVANEFAQGRVVSLLEGGYYLPALARSVEAHLRALLEVD